MAVPTIPTQTNPNELSVTILASNGTPQQTITGWQDIRVTRSIERPPSSFEIGLTENYPASSKQVVLKPGDGVVVKIGNDTVITGWVDSYQAEISPRSHSVRISGRSKCADLYDCSAGQAGINLPYASLLTLAQKLAEPFNVNVKKMGTWTEIPYPVLMSSVTERVYAIIETVARYNNVLVYDDTDGSLVLGSVAAGTHQSGFLQGQNIQQAAVGFSMLNRYQTYIALWQSVNTYAFAGSTNQSGVATDPQVTRYRPLIFVSEQNAPGFNIAQMRADYEKNMRWGRGQVVHIVCDSWRDAQGILWTPNFLAPLDIPAIKVNNQTWIIADVTFVRNLHAGTIAQLSLMPQEAFTVNPINPLSSLGQLETTYNPPAAPAATGTPATPSVRGGGGVM